MPRGTKQKKYRFTKKRGGNNDEGYYTPMTTPPRSRSNSVSSTDSFMTAIGDGVLFFPEEEITGEIPDDVIQALGPAVQAQQQPDEESQSQIVEQPPDIEAIRPLKVKSLQSVRSQPGKNIDIGKGLLSYFDFKGQIDRYTVRDITQKIYFFVTQEHLLKGLLGLTHLGLSQHESARFLTVFEGSFFLRLQTGFSFNTSDFDVKVYPLDGNLISSYAELLERITPVSEYVSQWNAEKQYPMYDQYQKPINVKTTELGMYVYQTILGLLIPAITDYSYTQKPKEQSKIRDLLQLLGELSIQSINSKPVIIISQPPNPTSPLKVVVKETVDGRLQYYAMADIAIAKASEESIVPKVNELIARNPDESILKSIKGFKIGSLFDDPVDLRIDQISSSNQNYIPPLLAYEVFDQVFYVPTPLYYYYEKKLLYCDIVDDKNMCKNKETWGDLGYPFGGRNIIKESHEYFEKKFRKSMKAITYGNIPQKYQGGKQNIKAKKRFTRKKK
jgi:hypothetical protein